MNSFNPGKHFPSPIRRRLKMKALFVLMVCSIIPGGCSRIQYGVLERHDEFDGATYHSMQYNEIPTTGDGPAVRVFLNATHRHNKDGDGYALHLGYQVNDPGHIQADTSFVFLIDGQRVHLMAVENTTKTRVGDVTTDVSRDEMEFYPISIDRSVSIDLLRRIGSAQTVSMIITGSYRPITLQFSKENIRRFADFVAAYG
jgi:hypothetical protein